MDTFIGYETALYYIKRLSAQGVHLPPITKDAAPSRFERSSELLSFITSHPVESSKFDVLVSSANGRRNGSFARCHVWSEAIPEASFWKLGPSIYLSSPEFCFLQMAKELSLAKLVQLGCELCGRYVLDAHAKRGFVQTKRPLTTLARLRKFLGRAPDCPGKVRAIRALTWIAENSWSPMETDTTILLVFPTKMGGYQMPPPILNRRIDLDGELQRRAGQSRYYLDLSWGDALALEFNGEDHLDKLPAGKDRTREAILHQLGMHTVVITEYQVFRMNEFDTIVKLLCKLLHRKYRQPTREQMAKKQALRRELFARLGPNAFVA